MIIILFINTFLKLSVNCICTSILVNTLFYLVFKYRILNILQNLYLNTFKKFLLQDCCKLINNTQQIKY